MKFTDDLYEKEHVQNKGLCKQMSSENLLTLLDTCQFLGVLCAVASINKWKAYENLFGPIGSILSFTVLYFGTGTFEMISLIAGGVLTLYQWISMYWFHKWAKITLQCSKNVRLNAKKVAMEKSIQKPNF